MKDFYSNKKKKCTGSKIDQKKKTSTADLPLTKQLRESHGTNDAEKATHWAATCHRIRNWEHGYGH